MAKQPTNEQKIAKWGRDIDKLRVKHQEAHAEMLRIERKVVKRLQQIYQASMPEPVEPLKGKIGDPVPAGSLSHIDHLVESLTGVPMDFLIRNMQSGLFLGYTTPDDSDDEEVPCVKWVETANDPDVFRVKTVADGINKVMEIDPDRSMNLMLAGYEA